MTLSQEQSRLRNEYDLLHAVANVKSTSKLYLTPYTSGTTTGLSSRGAVVSPLLWALNAASSPDRALITPPYVAA